MGQATSNPRSRQYRGEPVPVEMNGPRHRLPRVIGEDGRIRVEEMPVGAIAGTRSGVRYRKARDGSLRRVLP